MHTIKRDGTLVPFDATKIEKAIYTAFLKDADGVMRPGASEASTSIRDKVTAITALVVANLNRRSNDGTVHIEDIQDQVELALMRSGEHKVARDYVLYREKQAQQRLQQRQADQPESLQERDFSIRRANGDEIYLTRDMILKNLGSACQRWDWQGNADLVMKSLVKLLFDGISEDEFVQAKIMATRPLIETDPMYAYTAGFFLLEKIRAEAFCQNPSDVFIGGSDYDANNYPANYFQDYIRKGVAIERLDKRLLDFDLDKMAEAIVPSRDLHFQYQGLQILYDRYLIHENGIRLELPQALWMRVAMGLAVNEIDREKWAIAFYNVLSTFRFVSSTPTLFNAGTTHPQLSSCYLTTVPDDLDGIFEAVKENALLSKFSGGLGNDWTPVRAMGSWIKGTNGKSQGVVPFLKVVNDTAVAVNQCFAPDTLVHTQDGPQPISRIQKGDLVLGVSGTYRQVDARMTYAQNDPMVEIRIKHSLMPIQVTTGHPVLAIQNVALGETSARTLKRLENGKRSPTWVDAGNLQVGDYVAQTIPGEVIPVAGFTDEEAYLYGIMLGDGHVAQKQGVNREYGVTLNATSKAHLAQFVRQYLLEHDIHFWENSAHGSVVQLRWAYGRTCLRDAVNGQFVAGEEAPVLPFDFADLYNAKGEKKVSARFLHLPESQTLAILKGLLQTDGHLARGKEIFFTTASLTLAENVRYLLLRLGIPSSGRQRDRRDEVHTATRKDGSQDTLSGGLSYELRIPAYPKIAALLGCEPVQKHMALRIGRWLFSRVTSIADITPVPFVCDLKVEGDESYMTTAFLAHNGGKRKGAVCAYLETWHLDIEEFLELRKNTGDDRRRTHDMNTANWIPDLFMKRVMDNAEWTLFSPNEVPDLHELYGTRFEERYAEYESMAENGQLEQFKKVPAVELWRKMLTMLFETGHPWITFKDPCNVRSPQRHSGVVHSSNLCTEITLNSSADETAVCNLGSVNLMQHLVTNPVVSEHGDELETEDWPYDQLRESMTPVNALRHINKEALFETVGTAIRMLDNVIDINFYPTRKARNANMRHRAIGLGVMGFADALQALRIPMDSEAAVTFAGVSQEVISFAAIQASADLAVARGSYSSFQGSDWSRGILPINTVQCLETERGMELLTAQQPSAIDPDLWDAVRVRVQHGIRNSNIMAIAPTATISNIVGVSQGIDPIYQNLYVKSNLSGEFTVVNTQMVADMEKLDLWDDVMVNDLKYFDGSLAHIDRIPSWMKRLYATAFEIDPLWLVRMTAERQKWIDQSVSLNLYMAKPSGKALDNLYKQAWLYGLKTTYYLRTMGATSAEKSTVTEGTLNVVQGGTPAPAIKACLIDDPTCEACQ
ncbi:ribonucleoside-diphosphate reductase subunit alpha [Acidithiobacillus thiooxidans]|uniref:ribonucleoside-diphosphate reductase subunit alpha n=2 Tax=Acidithiobacillus thiooxidans TaxID=930 RepID=UPI001C079B46|nr:ribonucleoside-diphosphate reductase subunit alpha [Acidithiobacillus thiooxidans]MBU2750600.1 ribonucleoside-diphosphate reductase subunit alpha [Acidithiobacillus thiooxidans]